jgi:hypothetical protein
MSDDVLVAYGRALELVGEVVWAKLSENTRANILLEELCGVVAERSEQPPAEAD